MKRNIFILLFAIVPFYYSCVSRESPNYATVISSIGATDNGSAFTAILTDTLSNDTMTLHARSKLILLRLTFPVSASSYNLATSNGQYYNYDNSGKVVKTFKLDAGYPNMVTGIVNNTTSSINKYVTGQFKARFILDTTVMNTDTSGTDTVTLTNGSFIAPYK